MRPYLYLCLLVGLTGCTSVSMNSYLDAAYKSYAEGDCTNALLEISQAERKGRARPWLQPEFSMLRGQCLEQQQLYADAAQTYRFIQARYPGSEYAYRAQARLDTLRQMGLDGGMAVATPQPVRKLPQR
ncbi:tetratricopeptide repeat protein [Pseudomonas oryzihabitans]|uniref:tetratricopeptide repeat protein n=1 Tax=Pseudomonas oryzihabitans TaxID=47885 RepID=UPI00111EB0E2|nr:hypothetical protein [Pseudomonas psychrotolerans]QDD89466.1 hypothetical protein CCZ28_10720 [Pseudomonas psychrotolerans]